MNDFSFDNDDDFDFYNDDDFRFDDDELDEELSDWDDLDFSSKKESGYPEENNDMPSSTFFLVAGLLMAILLAGVILLVYALAGGGLSVDINREIMTYNNDSISSTFDELSSEIATEYALSLNSNMGIAMLLGFEDSSDVSEKILLRSYAYSIDTKSLTEHLDILCRSDPKDNGYLIFCRIE